MTNRTRRKIMRIAYRDKIGHLSASEREDNKQLNGKPTRSLSDSERRYWSQVNRYCRSTGKPDSVAGNFLVKVS